MSRAINRSTFDDAVARCHIPDELPQPPSHSPITPIPGLAITQGLYCSYCPLASPSDGVMRKHINECHADALLRDRKHTMGLMQQYNAATNRRWFRVRHPERSESSPSPDDNFRKANYCILNNNSIDPNTSSNVQNVSSWLRHCQYHRYTEGLDKDEAMARVALVNEKELAPLNNAVDEYINQCEECIDIAHVNILQQLNSEDSLAECVILHCYPSQMVC